MSSGLALLIALDRPSSKTLASADKIRNDNMRGRASNPAIHGCHLGAAFPQRNNKAAVTKMRFIASV